MHLCTCNPVRVQLLLKENLILVANVGRWLSGGEAACKSNFSIFQQDMKEHSLHTLYVFICYGAMSVWNNAPSAIAFWQKKAIKKCHCHFSLFLEKLPLNSGANVT